MDQRLSADCAGVQECGVRGVRIFGKDEVGWSKTESLRSGSTFGIPTCERYPYILFESLCLIFQETAKIFAVSKLDREFSEPSLNYRRSKL